MCTASRTAEPGTQSLSAFDPKATGAIVVDDTTVVVLMGDRVLDLTAGGDQPLSTNPIESTSAVPLVIGEDGSLYSIDNWVLARHIGSEPAAYRSTAYPWFTTPDGNVVGVEYGIGVAITLMQPDGTTIARASGWDEVPAIVFDFEHERLLAAEQDGWNVLALSTRDLTRSNTGIELPRCPTRHSRSLPTAACSPRLGRTVSGESRIDVVDLVDGTVVFEQVRALDDSLSVIDVVPDGTALLVAGVRGVATVIDLATGRESPAGYPELRGAPMWLGHLPETGLVAVVDAAVDSTCGT